MSQTAEVPGRKDVLSEAELIPLSRLGARELIRRAKQDDVDAWNELFARLLHDLVPVEWGHESTVHVLGNAWERGWRGIRHFCGDGKVDDPSAYACLCVWMRRVFHTAKLNALTRQPIRQRRSVPLVPSRSEDSSTSAAADPVDPNPLPPDILIQDEELSWVRRFLPQLRETIDALPNQDRELIDKVFFQKISMRKIALEWNRHEKSVRQRLARILRDLSERLSVTLSRTGQETKSS